MGDAELAGSVELMLRRGALQRRGYTTPRLGEDRFRSEPVAKRKRGAAVPRPLGQSAASSKPGSTDRVGGFRPVQIEE
jgi:hypothetical protein